jgi:hypothetical protein
MSTEAEDGERRFPRRLLLTASAAAAAVGVAEAVSSPASAASGATAWKLGGNSRVAANGSNFIGPTNAAPLIFKTRASHSKPLTERMRITPAGLIGIGVHSPVCQVGVKSALDVAVRGTTSSTKATSNGVNGIATAGIGVQGNAKAGMGVQGTATGGNGVVGNSTGGAGVLGNSTNLYGVQGTGGYCGVRGNGGPYGGIFSGGGNGSIGVYGIGSAYGMYGSGSTYGMYGSGTTYGQYGSGQTGVYGSGSVAGVTGTTTNVNGDAVNGTGGMYGVHGVNGRTAGTRGDSNYVGAWGQAPSYAVYGLCTATGGTQGFGVFGETGNAASFAVYAKGNAHVEGTLSKSAGSFKIDHPLDPDHRWLSHSFVESPDMMNVYNGNVTLDGNGEATVDLPEYFGVLNRDFRYQLTPIGAHAPVYIAAKVKDNAFRIAGGTPGLEVSWQVTGIRQDDYATEHPIVVDQAKSAEDRGTRQFVAPGSSARQMRVAPARPEPSAVPPHVAPTRIPAIR